MTIRIKADLWGTALFSGRRIFTLYNWTGKFSLAIEQNDLWPLEWSAVADCWLTDAPMHSGPNVFHALLCAVLF